MVRLYIESKNGLLDTATLSATARTLLLLDPEAELPFSHDESGHFFEVSKELLERFVAQTEGEETPAPRKRGRPRKNPEPQE
jgi:hypothetical protein